MLEESITEKTLKGLKDEVFASQFYARLARIYGVKSIQAKLEEICRMETRHASFWLGFLAKRGQSREAPRPNTFMISAKSVIARALGLGLTLSVLERGEQDAVDLYSEILDRPELDSEEKAELRRVMEDELLHEHMFIEEGLGYEGFRTYIRDAVLGMNDGLVQILSVTTGLAGAYANPIGVALGGLIVAISGALSMGIGVYASVRAQRQVHEGTLFRITHASRYVAHVFKERLAHHMSRKGYSLKTSEALAEESSRNLSLLSKAIAEEEYGLREGRFASPEKAGLYSLISNGLGALVPLLPYFLGLSMNLTVVLSLLMAGIALAVTGFLIAVTAGTSIAQKAREMVLIGLGTSAITFVIGKAVSILIGAAMA